MQPKETQAQPKQSRITEEFLREYGFQITGGIKYAIYKKAQKTTIFKIFQNLKQSFYVVPVAPFIDTVPDDAADMILESSPAIL